MLRLAPILAAALAAAGAVRADAAGLEAPAADRHDPAATAGDPYLEELVARARERRLALDPAWLRLGHYRARLLGGFESEADGPAFFLSPRGRDDPAAELEATLRGLFAPEPAASADGVLDATRDHPQCRFPARFALLARALPIDLARLPLRACPRFEAFWRRVGARSVTLVFSSYYLNNPASAFGHTFLRLGKVDPEAGEERYDLVDQGVDYAAVVDTGNALLYAFKGLTGLFRGEFTARPYFYKVREYADFESRDLWEYELALDEGERAMLVGHLWELGQTWFDYYYATKNCSYHILGALEAASPRLELLSRVSKITVPADTVKALFANPGLVRAVRFRPSARTQLDARASRLSATQVDDATILADGGEPPGLALAPPVDEARVLDTALDLVDVRHGREIVEGTDPAAERLRQRLLERRAAIPVVSEPLVITPPASGGPERGHPSMRLGVGGGGSSRDGPLVVLDARMALHDLIDPPAGFSDRTQLEFLKARVAFLTRSQSLRLDDASLVEATSLNPLGSFERRVSWKLRAGAVRVTDAGCPDCVAGRFEIGGGPALVAWHDRLVAAVTADAELLGAPRLSGAGGTGLRPGIGPAGILRLAAGDRGALLATAGWRWLPFATPGATFELAAVGRLHLGRASLQLEWRRVPIATEAVLSLQVYAR